MFIKCAKKGISKHWTQFVTKLWDETEWHTPVWPKNNHSSSGVERLFRNTEVDCSILTLMSLGKALNPNLLVINLVPAPAISV